MSLFDIIGSVITDNEDANRLYYYVGDFTATVDGVKYPFKEVVVKFDKKDDIFAYKFINDKIHYPEDRLVLLTDYEKCRFTLNNKNCNAIQVPLLYDLELAGEWRQSFYENFKKLKSNKKHSFLKSVLNFLFRNVD